MTETPAYQVIMAPTDGSEAEWPAIILAVDLAKRFDAELRLVRVETPPVPVDPHSGPGVLEQTEETLAAARRAREKDLEAVAAKCRELGAKVVASLESGIVTAVLRDYADRYRAGLIVMASHSRGGVKRITLGSVADYLIRSANVPVLVVKPSLSGQPASATFRRIVVPLDGSHLANQILPQVAALAAQTKSAVSLLHILTPATYSQQQVMQAGLPWWEADIESAKEYLARAAGYLENRGVSAHFEVVLSSTVPTAIIEYADSADADLLAITSNGVGGIRRLVFGSIADQLTRESKISLLVFHPAAVAADPGGSSTVQSPT